MLAADDKLFAVSARGSIYCFGPQRAETKRYPHRPRPLVESTDRWTAKDSGDPRCRRSPGRAGRAVGHWQRGGCSRNCCGQSKLQIIAIEPDTAKVARWKRRLDQAGHDGRRVAVHAGSPAGFGLPPYLARLIVAEEESGQDLASIQRQLAHQLRPYGGTAVLPMRGDNPGLPRRSGDIEIRRQGESLWFHRPGPLAGAADYHGDKNADELVRAPLGLLWFGDTYHHHKLF